MVTERAAAGARVRRVGAEVSVDVHEVLEAVDGQVGQPCLPTALDPSHRGVAEWEMRPDADVVGAVLRVGVPHDDDVPLDLGHQHRTNLAKPVHLSTEMTGSELAERAGVTVVNLSVLKNGRARAVRFSTLTAICRVLDCQPGDLFVRARLRTNWHTDGTLPTALEPSL